MSHHIRKTSTKHTWLALATLLGIWLPSAQAATRYVATTGTDGTSCGTSAAPCAKVNYVLDNKVSAGDTIRVKPGSYSNLYLYAAVSKKQPPPPQQDTTTVMSLGRVEQLEQRFRSLDVRIDENAKLQTTLSDQLKTATTLLKQIAEDYSNKDKDKKDTLDSFTAGSDFATGFTLYFITILSVLGVGEYWILRKKLEADLRKKGELLLEESKYKTSARIYSNLSYAYYLTYNKLSTLDSMFGPALDLAVMFAEGHYVQAEGLKGTPGSKEGKYTEDSRMAENNFAYHLAT
jgi:hypothetical protein